MLRERHSFSSYPPVQPIPAGRPAMKEHTNVRSNDSDWVKDLPLFKSMNEDRFEAMMQPAFLQRFPPHVLLFERGQSPDFLHVLLEGAVETFARHEDRETTVGITRPVSTFMLSAVVTRQPGLTSARTLETSRILMIPTEAVHKSLKEDITFTFAIAHELAGAYRGVVKELKSQKLRTSVERLANWILREDRLNGSHGQFEIPFDKRTLASRLGMTPENLSRNFATLVSHGVEVQGRVIKIVDNAKLVDLASPDPLIDEPEQRA
jgi:CRP/FNR family transcriptional activator FtrB